MASDTVWFFFSNKSFLWKLLVFKRNARRTKKLNDTFSEIGQYFPEKSNPNHFLKLKVLCILPLSSAGT